MEEEREGRNTPERRKVRDEGTEDEGGGGGREKGKGYERRGGRVGGRREEEGGRVGVKEGEEMRWRPHPTKAQPTNNVTHPRISLQVLSTLCFLVNILLKVLVTSLDELEGY